LKTYQKTLSHKLGEAAYNVRAPRALNNPNDVKTAYENGYHDAIRAASGHIEACERVEHRQIPGYGRDAQAAYYRGVIDGNAHANDIGING
jgi:hypothetical protein